MGGTGRASVDVSDALFLNPAAVALTPTFQMDWFYADGRLNAGEQETYWGVSLMDNSFDVVVPGAISYIKGRRNFSVIGPVDEQFLRAAFGKTLLPGWSFGFSVERLSQKLQNGESFLQWDGSMGLAYHHDENLSMALTYSSFAYADSAVPEALRLLTEIGVGMRYSYEKFMEFRADVVRPREGTRTNHWQTGIGIRTQFVEFFNLSLGANWDGPRGTKLVTGGFAFAGPKFRLDYSIEKNLDETRELMHSVDLRMPF